MADFALIYGLRLLPTEDLEAVEDAVVRLKGGKTARVTMHLLNRDQSERHWSGPCVSPSIGTVDLGPCPHAGLDPGAARNITRGSHYIKSRQILVGPAPGDGFVAASHATRDAESSPRLLRRNAMAATGHAEPVREGDAGGWYLRERRPAIIAGSNASVLCLIFCRSGSGCPCVASARGGLIPCPR